MACDEFFMRAMFAYAEMGKKMGTCVLFDNLDCSVGFCTATRLCPGKRTASAISLETRAKQNGRNRRAERQRARH
jgi:hypothetical protein